MNRRFILSVFISLALVVALCGIRPAVAQTTLRGTTWAWGANDSGQLGNGTTTDSTTPVPVSFTARIVAIAAGKGHSLALKADGTVWAWGRNSGGALGNGTFN